MHANRVQTESPERGRRLQSAQCGELLRRAAAGTGMRRLAVRDPDHLDVRALDGEPAQEATDPEDLVVRMRSQQHHSLAAAEIQRRKPLQIRPAMCGGPRRPR